MGGLLSSISSNAPKTITKSFACPKSSFISRLSLIKSGSYFTVPIFQCSSAAASAGLDICAINQGVCLSNDAGFSSISVIKDSTGKVVQVSVQAIGVDQPMVVSADAYSAAASNPTSKGAKSLVTVRHDAPGRGKGGKRLPRDATPAANITMTLTFDGQMIYLTDLSFEAPLISSATTASTNTGVVIAPPPATTASTATPAPTATASAKAAQTARKIHMPNKETIRKWAVLGGVALSAAALYYFDMIMD